MREAAAIFGEAGLVLIAALPDAGPGSLSAPATPFGLASQICLPERNLQRLKLRWMFANYLSPAARDLVETQGRNVSACRLTQSLSAVIVAGRK